LKRIGLQGTRTTTELAVERNPEMEEQSGETYQGSPYERAVFATKAKVGKTVALVCNLLGAMPWQKTGAVVTSPSHLHILTSDSDALQGVREFILENCEMSHETVKYKVYNLEKDVRTVSEVKEQYQHGLFLKLTEVRDLIASRIRPGEVHAVLISSLTGFSRGLERELMGAPIGTNRETGKGYGAIDLWKMNSATNFNFQDMFQALDAHIIWEAHLSEFERKVGNRPEDTVTEEKLAISGAAGNPSSGITFNVSRVFRITRKNTRYKSKDGKTADGKAIPAKLTKAGKNEWPVDEVYFDTDVSGSFVANGRMVASRLERSEFDMTRMFKKLGLKVGGWKPKA
jgi:hypothetical protein